MASSPVCHWLLPLDGLHDWHQARPVAPTASQPQASSAQAPMPGAQGGSASILLFPAAWPGIVL